MVRKIMGTFFLLFFLSITYADFYDDPQGCCSWHGGINYCAINGRVVCNDGNYSPSCTCTPTETLPPEEYEKQKKQLDAFYHAKYITYQNCIEGMRQHQSQYGILGLAGQMSRLNTCRPPEPYKTIFNIIYKGKIYTEAQWLQERDNIYLVEQQAEKQRQEEIARKQEQEEKQKRLYYRIPNKFVDEANPACSDPVIELACTLQNDQCLAICQSMITRLHYKTYLQQELKDKVHILDEIISIVKNKPLATYDLIINYAKSFSNSSNRSTALLGEYLLLNL